MTTSQIPVKPGETQVWMTIDPGATTGVALWIGDELTETRQVECGRKYEDQLVGVRLLAEIVKLLEIELLVYEDFLLRGGSPGTTDRVGLAPVQVTGLLIGMLDVMVPWPVRAEGQLASGAKSVLTDKRLKMKNMYVKGPHARDAVRHGLLFLRRSMF